MARRTENMLEAFKVSREQAIEATRQALEPQPETMGQKLRRSLPKGWKPGGSKEDEGSQGPVGPEGQVSAPAEQPAGSPALRGANPVPVGTAMAQGLGVQPGPARSLVDYSDHGNTTVQDFEGRIPMSPWTLIGFSVTLALLSFVLGWQLGMRGDREAKAPDNGPLQGSLAGQLPDPAALPGRDDVPLQAAPLEDQAGLADLAFEDPSNHYTLVVDQFNDNRKGRERAIAQYRYLNAQGFPVMQPRLRGDVVYILVGAAPERGNLAELLVQLQALPYPGSQDRTFSNSYQERIENFF